MFFSSSVEKTSESWIFSHAPSPPRDAVIIRPPPISRAIGEKGNGTKELGHSHVSNFTQLVINLSRNQRSCKRHIGH